MTPIFRALLVGVFLLGLTGCGQKAEEVGHGHVTTGGHVHVAPHGGTLVEIGEHAYNLELLRDAAGGKLTAWVLDSHAENFVRIKAASVDLVATIGAAPRPLSLKAVANAATGETVGDTAQFEAPADWLKGTAGFGGVITTLEIRGTKFEKIGFTLSPPAK